MLTSEYKRELAQESDGHPYVIKMLLGEVARAGHAVKVDRIVASKDTILEALFERTYSGLTPAAKLVFLTLCNWRSTVPQLAIEAVMLRTNRERIDVDQAIQELRRTSFIDVSSPEGESEAFLTVPLVASVFGRRKLGASPLKAAIQANTELLLCFGAGQRTDIKHGIAPRIEKLFRSIAAKVNREQKTLADHLPMLEFVAQRYYPAWLLIASLHEESSESGALESAKHAIRKYLEISTDQSGRRAAWNRLAGICRRTEDWVGEVHALVEISAVADIPFQVVSNAVNRWNSLFRHQFIPLGNDERRLLAERLLDIAENRRQEADAIDCSRIAWLSLALHDETRAAEFTRLGLALDPENEHVRKLAERLQITKENLAANAD